MKCKGRYICEAEIDFYINTEDEEVAQKVMNLKVCREEMSQFIQDIISFELGATHTKAKVTEQCAVFYKEGDTNA